MAKIFPLFSSSSGNCTYIEIGSDALLIDAGASFKAINEELLGRQIDISKVRGVAVTHEHIDHIKGLKALLGRTGIPLIASEKTAEALIKRNVIPEKTEIIAADKGCVSVGDLTLNRFATSHDCEGSSGYTVTKGNIKVGLCTDLGIVTDEIINALENSNCLLIESNHDIEMLKKGPYPPELKLRILSDVGHLSNNACASAVSLLLNKNVNRFILGHLSEKNNTPLHALKTTENLLMSLGAEKDSDYLLSVAKKMNNTVTVI